MRRRGGKRRESEREQKIKELSWEKEAKGFTTIC